MILDDPRLEGGHGALRNVYPAQLDSGSAGGFRQDVPGKPGRLAVGAAEDEGLGVMEADAPRTGRHLGPTPGGEGVPQATGCNEEEQEGDRTTDEHGASCTDHTPRQPHAAPPHTALERDSKRTYRRKQAGWI